MRMLTMAAVARVFCFSPLFALACALSSLPTCADDWHPPNLVRNGGFEDLSEAGLPAHWNVDGEVFRSVTEPVHSGHRALRYENSDPSRYILCSQSLPLEPGKAYELSVWIKTENIEGEDSGATICLEWSDAEGQYLGGHYPSGFKGTSDWRHLTSVSGRVPEEAVHCSVTCYVRKGMTGKAWWDDVEVRQWREPPLSTFLLTPNYRGWVWPRTKQIEVLANVTLRDYELGLNQVRVRAEIVRKSDEKVVATHQQTPTQPQTMLRLRRRFRAPGDYRLSVKLEAKEDGRELASDSWRLRVLGRNERVSRISYIDEYNRLVRDGKPFFPLGMYWGSINEDDLKIYADSPFNCLMPYGSPSKEQMDLAQQYGLKVIYSVKDIYYGSRYCPEGIKTLEDERAFIEAKVQNFRTHPALLAWYLNDELPLGFLDRLEAHQEWLEELDPDHPTWIVLYQVEQLFNYRRTFDVIGADPYPIPRDEARRAAQWTEMAVRSFHGRRAVWMVPQVFNWAVYRKTEEEKAGLRPPTLAEMRSMAWQCITHGANGLIFYSFFDLKRDEVVPFEEQWSRVKQMAAEIRDMIPILLSVQEPPKVYVREREWLHWTARKLGPITYLIVVNDEGRKHQATFKLSEVPVNVRLHGRSDHIPVSADGRLRVTLGSFAVKIYEIQF